MKKWFLAGWFLFSVAVPCFCVGWEAGVVGTGGPSFLGGSSLDARGAVLAEAGSTTPGALGRSITSLLPGGSVGLYAELHLAEWLSIRLEPRLAYFGGARVALTDGGTAFCRYGASFPCLLAGLLLRGRIPAGSGWVTLGAGPFYGIVPGAITVVDRYSSSITTAAVTLPIRESEVFGLTGGAGYAFALGPGLFAVELRIDWAMTPVGGEEGALGGTLAPLEIGLATSYALRLGRGRR